MTGITCECGTGEYTNNFRTDRWQRLQRASKYEINGAVVHYFSFKNEMFRIFNFLSKGHKSSPRIAQVTFDAMCKLSIPRTLDDINAKRISLECLIDKSHFDI